MTAMHVGKSGVGAPHTWHCMRTYCTIWSASLVASENLRIVDDSCAYLDRTDCLDAGATPREVSRKMAVFAGRRLALPLDHRTS